MKPDGGASQGASNQGAPARGMLERGIHKGLRTSWELIKVMAPVSIAVTALKHTPVLPWLSDVSGPLMRWLGLSGEAAVVLVAGNAVGLYPAIGAMASLDLSAKELLILSLMLSFSHNLLVETAVTKRLGVNFWGVLAYRVGLAIVAALLVNAVYGVLVPDSGGSERAVIPVERPAISLPADAAPGQLSVADEVAGGVPAAPESPAGAAWRWLVTVATDAARSLSRTLTLVIVIIIPLMVAIEALRANGTLERLSRRIAPYMGWLGMSGKAGFPLLAGIVFGLAYGAGVILEAAKDNELTLVDKRLLCVFLVACHAAIEDTVLFIPLGVNPFLLLGSRFTLALVLTVLVARSGIPMFSPSAGMPR